MSNFPDSTRPSVYWTPTCPQCQTPYGLDVYLDEPLRVGTQCPRCLELLDTQPLATQIHAYWSGRAQKIA